MKNLKNFKQFEAHIDVNGELQNMDWEGPKRPFIDKKGLGGIDWNADIDEEEFIEAADLGLKQGEWLEDSLYVNLRERLKEIYKEMTVEDKKVFYHGPAIVQDILEEYPEECKICIEQDILNSKKLPYSFEVIDILPIDYQKLIISLILSNFEKYEIEEIQYDSFDVKVQKIIDFNKDKIIITWKKQGI